MTLLNNLSGTGVRFFLHKSFMQCYFAVAIICKWNNSEKHELLERITPSASQTITATKINTLRLRQHGRDLTDDTFKSIFLNENVRISIQISLKLVPQSPINNTTALVQIMAWLRPGDKPLSEPRLVSLLTHICVTRRQWVKTICIFMAYTIEKDIKGYWRKVNMTRGTQITQRRPYLQHCQSEGTVMSLEKKTFNL